MSEERTTEAYWDGFEIRRRELVDELVLAADGFADCFEKAKDKFEALGLDPLDLEAVVKLCLSVKALRRFRFSEGKRFIEKHKLSKESPFYRDIMELQHKLKVGE